MIFENRMREKFLKKFVYLDMLVYSEEKGEVEGWLVKEIDFWKDILSRCYPKGVVAGVENSEVVEYLHDLEEIKAGVNKANGSLKMFGVRIKEVNVSRKLPCFDEELSTDFRSSVVSDETLKMALFVYRASLISSAVTLENFVDHWQTGIADEIKSSKQSTFVELNKHQKAINDRSDEYLKAIDDDGNAKLKFIRDEAEKVRSAAIESIKDFESIATGSIVSSEPVKFWNDKRKHHRLRAVMFSAGSLLLIAGVIYLLGKLLYVAYSSGTQKTELFDLTMPDHYLVTLAILLGSVGVWILRVLIKLMMTNLTLESEALSKLTAIKTYVVLSKSKLSEETVNGFHKSLLQSGPADFSVDGTSPELVKIVELILQKKEKP
ncbi:MULTISPECIES: hypothetical protein [Pseudomonas]|jgi:hypothetical protein|uniref:hypothetical protein n=1 Tax=Pseudomonas TaxID=286 RepID=UPI001070E71D|nr:MULTISPECIES: hypothetical protein [Pseudomonas]MBY8959663.1 hypothetical protein [Pseudomonas sp. MIS38]QBR32654.1 hypothetical protein E3Z29_20035 [Pseudomonas sp. S150]UZT90824.1 hypothetical protein OPS05_17045 [Pseudomonas koreensis]